MKIGYLAIIIGLGVALIVIGNSNLLFAQEGGFDLTGAKTYSIIDSPLKQFKSGIKAQDVKCESNFLLVIKSSDNSPACAKPQTALILLERGWGNISSPFDTTVDLLDSKISGGKIIGFHYDLHPKIVVVKLETSSDGNLKVTIPRQLLDANTKGNDESFVVLCNGKETDFAEINTTNSHRTLAISFGNGTDEIEILGNFVSQQAS